jgi:hypothetical protein
VTENRRGDFSESLSPVKGDRGGEKKVERGSGEEGEGGGGGGGEGEGELYKRIENKDMHLYIFALMVSIRIKEHDLLQKKVYVFNLGDSKELDLFYQRIR